MVGKVSSAPPPYKTVEEPCVRFLPATHSLVVRTAPLVNGATYVSGVCTAMSQDTVRLALGFSSRLDSCP